MPGSWRYARLATVALALLGARSAYAQQMGNLFVKAQTDSVTGEDRTSATTYARRGAPGGLLVWQCVEGGSAVVGIALAGSGREGDSRIVSYRFDGGREDTTTVSRLDPQVYWYLAAPHVAPFIVGAKGARRLVIRAQGNAAAPAQIEYVYDLAGAGPALEKLPCARGTPTAGRPLPFVEPPDEGTYEMAAVEELPRIRNRAEIDRLLEQGFPPDLRATGGRVVVRYRVLENGRVDSASVTVTESTHEALSELARTVVRRMIHTPARTANRPVVVWAEVPLNFPAMPVEADSAAAPPPPRP